MNLQEYEQIKDFTYLEYCDYLQAKYGMSKYPYMTENWEKEPRVTRTKEGLFAHHKCENRAIQLSTKEYAMQHPYEWQEKQNIVYCDYLEHLLLHELIVELSLDEKNGQEHLGIGGMITFMIPELNDVFSGWRSNLPWQKNCHGKIFQDKDVYLKIIERLIYRFSGFSESLEETKNYLCRSHNSKYGSWDNANNYDLYDEICDIWRSQDAEKKFIPLNVCYLVIAQPKKGDACFSLEEMGLSIPDGYSITEKLIKETIEDNTRSNLKEIFHKTFRSPPTILSVILPMQEYMRLQEQKREATSESEFWETVQKQDDFIRLLNAGGTCEFPEKYIK